MTNEGVNEYIAHVPYFVKMQVEMPIIMA